MAGSSEGTLRSWLAGTENSDFPLQNLPYGVFRRAGDPHVGVAIGDRIFDVATWARSEAAGTLPEPLRDACLAANLNPLMALDADLAAMLRARLQQELGSGNAARAARLEPHLQLQAEAEMLLPAAIGDYTDFYASIDHATAVGRLFRPDHPLLPNYKHVPIGYHGRASSIVVSGTDIRRPAGQLPGALAAAAAASADPPPVFGATRQLDYEMELGVFVGAGNALGQPIRIADAGRHLFGVCLVNDWSARDIQRWEYQPLGPFLGKNFATSISPWVVTMAALEPYRQPPAPRAPGDPAPLAYLADARDAAAGAFALTLEVELASRAMRTQGIGPIRLGRASAGGLYWTLAQMVAHHTVNGCNLRPGDLLASGTVSGPGPEQRGCLLECTGGGAPPITLPTGETRRFLEDGDEVTLRGYAECPGQPRIGLGVCSGVILAANP